MRFICCDSIQSRLLVSDRFEIKTMTWLELKIIDQINRIVKCQPKSGPHVVVNIAENACDNVSTRNL